MPWGRRGLPAVFGLWALGCHPGACPDPSRESRLQVEYAGCQEVLRGPPPACVLNDARELRLWIRSPAGAELELTVGGEALESPHVDAGGGRRFSLTVPDPATEIVVRQTAPAAAWCLKLAPEERLHDGGALAEQGFALRAEGRHELRQGEYGRAAELFDESVKVHRQTGRLLYEYSDAGERAYCYVRLRRFAEARRVLAALDLPHDAPAEAAFYRLYNRGLLSAMVGDFRSALDDLEAAARLSEHLGMTIGQLRAEQLLGWQLQVLGRTREAGELYARPRRGAALGPCDEASWLNNRAWTSFLAREAGETVEDPLPLLERVEEIYDGDECEARPDQRLNVLINLGLAHRQAGRLEPSRARLRQAMALRHEATPLQRAWLRDLEARLALDEGRPAEALRLYEELERQAAQTHSPSAAWEAALGRARAYEAQGERDLALRALEKAESLLDEQSLRIPIHEGHELFLAQREAGVRFFIELLLRSGRDREALTVARRSRSRVLRRLRLGERLARLPAAEQDRWDEAIAEYVTGRAALDAAAAGAWERPLDEQSRFAAEMAGRDRELQRALDRAFMVFGVDQADLPALRPHDLVLAYHPLPHGWVGFAADDREVTVHRFELTDGILERPEELSQRLLVPFRQRIAGASRVRLLPYGPLRAQDFSALPFAGDVLVAAVPVVYGLDLGTSPTPSEGVPRGLIVADPRNDLLAARKEAKIVRDSFPASWPFVVLQGDEAGEPAVRQALLQADLFHYAGHGAFDDRGGWESALLLAGPTRLTPGHILGLGRAPRWVVLSGCETARTVDAPVESIGLAQAFLAVGTRQAIAAVRPVGDGAAQGLFAHLYEQWSTRPEPDLAVLLRNAQLAWRQQDPSTGHWASFRVLEP